MTIGFTRLTAALTCSFLALCPHRYTPPGFAVSPFGKTKRTIIGDFVRFTKHLGILPMPFERYLVDN